VRTPKAFVRQGGLPGTVNLFTSADVRFKALPYTGSAGLGRLQTETGKSLLAEDMNGDGTDDVIIGSPGASFVSTWRNNGVVHVFFGNTALAGDHILDSDYDLALKGPVPIGKLAGGKLGESVAAGKVTGSGARDLFIGVPKSVGPSTKTDSGVVVGIYDLSGSRAMPWLLLLLD
jgi:hypothetical protein